MSFGVLPSCDGCGACVRACPRGAIRISVEADTPYEVVGLACNDCGKCAIVCPPGALVPDPRWAACWGRGCPLSSRRFEGWTCTEGYRRCPSCGSALWKAPESDAWFCARCDGTRRVVCPKIRRTVAARGG
ncbi:MAG: 4Fe-4S dicluster domain-containing protein [Acidimicrobiia bacterium]|nr:4Fe-4S dicluster domain-containing protein [Acidimicrobiia bacterium]